jgi:xylan 1,4-beta-xylosidase
MKRVVEWTGILCLVVLLVGGYLPAIAENNQSRIPPQELKDFCYEQLWDVLLHPTNADNNRKRQDMLHQLAEMLSKVGYSVEKVIPSRHDLMVLMNQNKPDQVFELIDDGILESCLLIREPISVHTNITVDCARITGTVKDFRQVNDGIYYPKRDSKGKSSEIIDLSGKMKELSMQSIRTHDAYGMTDPVTNKIICGLDMHYLYPDTTKDPFDPSSYQFDIMDSWIKKINEIGAQVFFRVGESWDVHPEPPKNVDNYVKAVVQILKHYQQGWASGFYYKIPYWEIWNEPALKVFWTGTSDQFIQLYAKIALALKKEDPSIQVGGPGNAGNFQKEWYYQFFAYIREHSIPFDFYSWHWYGIRPYEVAIIAGDVQKDLESFGFYHTKQLITEWNIDVWGSIEGKKVGNNRDRGNQFFNSMFNAAFHGCALTHLQDSPVIMAHHYRGDAGGFGLLDESGNFNRVGMFYQNLSEFMSCPSRLSVTSYPSQESFTCLAGSSLDQTKIQLLVSDARLGTNPYTIELINFKKSDRIRLKVYRLQPDGSMKTVKEMELTTSPRMVIPLEIQAPTIDRIEISLIP